MEYKVPDEAKILMQKLIDNGYEAFIVGGWVRDTILGFKPNDIDIFTDCQDLLSVFPEGKVIGNEERQKKILTVIVNGIEVSTFRKSGDRTKTGNNIIEHCSTCDLTFNALSLNINGILYDFHKGVDDLSNKKIRFIGSPIERIKEDPLRILRAMRFENKYRAKIVSSHEFIMLENFYLLKTIPIERVRDEFMKIIKYGSDLVWVFFYTIFIPELMELENLEGGHYHLEDCLTHSFYAFENALKLTDNQLIHLACLFHDIGKAVDYRLDKDGKVSFNGHQTSGSELVIKIMNRLKFSKDEIKFVSTMVKHHMMGSIDKLNNNTIIKIVNDLESAGITIEDMLIMTYSDNQANMKHDRMKFNEFYQNNNWLRKVYELKYQRLPFKVKDLEIGGKDVMEYGIKGKEIGEILQKIYSEVINAKLENTRHKLLYRLKELI